jgi:hypothetical protein
MRMKLAAAEHDLIAIPSSSCRTKRTPSRFGKQAPLDRGDEFGA